MSVRRTTIFLYIMFSSGKTKWKGEYLREGRQKWAFLIQKQMILTTRV